MRKEILIFGDIKVVKDKFYCHKSTIFKKDVDIEKVLVSNKISCAEKKYKYFIGYLYNDHNIKLLHIMLPRTSAYVKSYNGQTKWMYSLIEDDDTISNTIFDKISSDITKQFNSEPIYNKIF